MSAPVAETPTAAAAGTTGWHRRRSVAGVLLPSPLVALAHLIAFVALSCLYWYAARQSYASDSDVATLVLQGQSIDHGHLLLGGWRMGVDSFWTIEVPFYAIGVALVGVNPVLMFLMPGVYAAATVLAGAGIARRQLTGAGRITAVVVFGTLLALPAGVQAWLFLRSGWHIATVLWCLIAFWAIRRGRWGPGVAVSAVFIAAGLLGDLQAAPYGAAPVAAAGIVAMARTRSVRRGLPALAAAAGGGLLYALVRYVVDKAGGLQLVDPNPSATGAQRIENAKMLPSWFAQAFGTGNGNLGDQGVPTVLTQVRFVGYVVVLVLLAVAVVHTLHAMIVGAQRGQAVPARHQPEHAWQVDDLLLLGTLGDLAFFVLATLRDDPGYLRYLTPGVVFAAILTGRLAGRWTPALLARVRALAWRRALAGVAVVLVGFYGAGTVSLLARPQPQIAVPQLVAFLRAHDLHDGVGNYWVASITTVYAHDDVRVRPVQGGGGHIVRYRKQSTADWYRDVRFQFVVYETTRDASGVGDPNAVAQFGMYSHKYFLGPYRILVWNTPFTMSAA